MKRRGYRKPLSSREQAVLQLMIDGQSNADIATALHLAPSTVKAYVSTILWKFEARDRHEVVRMAIQDPETA